MKQQPSSAEIRRQILRWRLAKLNKGKLWPIDVSKLGLSNLSTENLDELLNLVKTIEFYEDRVDVTYGTTAVDGKTLFHGALVKLKEKKHEDHSEQS